MSVKRTAVIIAAVAVAAAIPAVAAQAGTTPPDPKTVTIDVAVDSHLGDTSAVIDCGPFGYQRSGPEGDGTLILANVYAPTKVRCTVTLRG